MVNVRERAGKIALAVLLAATPLLAQWTLQVQMPNVYPTPYTSDWENLPGIVNITIQYTGTEASTVQVLSHAVSVEHGDLADGNSDDIVFSGPQTVHKDNRDFWNYKNIEYSSQYRDKILQTGRLLEGTYDLHVKLVRVGTNESLAGGTKRFYILSFNAPSLVAPANHDTVQVSFPSFMWSPATTHPGFVTRYDFRVCEMLSNQTPEQAINNIPRYSATIVNATSTIYPNSAPPLEVGKKYAWRVQARDKNNIPIGDNDGKSEVFEFQMKANAPPPPPPPPPPPNPAPTGGGKIDSLLLQSGVAYIKDFSGEMTPDGSDYALNGTATMHISALGGNEVTSCAVTNLKITLNQSSPFNSTVKSGTVDRVVQNGTLFAWRNNFIGVTHVRFSAGQADPVTIDAFVNLPKVGVALTANGLALGTTGIKPTTQATAQEFNRWGTGFAVSSITVGDSTSVGYAILGGTLKLKIGSSEQNLGPFSGMGFNSNGNIHGSFDINNFALIPGTSYLRLTKCVFTVNNGTDCLEFDGLCGGLPSPMDKILSASQPFSLLLDADGNVKVNAALINEFSSRGKGNDASEFNIPAVGIALDLTYLGVDWKTGPGGGWCPGLTMAMDIYFPTTQGDKRVAVGELQGGQVVNGIQIDNAGSLNWPAIDLSPMGNSSLLIGDLLEVPFQALSLVTNSPLKIQFSGPLSLNVPGVSGSVQIDNAAIDLDGNITFPGGLNQAEFTLVDAFSVSVQQISWSSQPSSVTFKKNCTTGSGTSRSFAQADTTVTVDSYFQMTGSKVNIGPGGAIASGTMDKFLVYRSGSIRRVLMIGAEANVYEMVLAASFDYLSDGSANNVVRCAGSLKVPNVCDFVAVGKFGKVNNQSSFGLFVAAQGLNMSLIPGILYLEDVGGGFFYNPEPVDIQTVKLTCGLDPNLANSIAVSPPGNPGDPGAFALFIYGAVSVVSPEIITGRALVTLAATKMEINAAVDVLRAAGIAHGEAYLGLHWKPKVYAEGVMTFNLNGLNLITGDGKADFYVYSPQVWGVTGAASLSMAGQTAGGDFFVGSPGLMASGHFGYDLDLYVLSGSMEMGAMVWYRTQNSAFGAYASIEAEGDILGGLVGASFGLEGALIHEPDYTIIYAVGELTVEVCYVDVFSGSVWISVGTNGFDGGAGRNSTYDQAIADARNMAAEMNQEKAKTEQQIASAKANLYALSDAQRQQAGKSLIEPNGWDDYMANRALYESEWAAWAPDTMDWVMRSKKSAIFNPTAESLAKVRGALLKQFDDGQKSLARVDAAAQAVTSRLAGFDALLTEQLPTVRSLNAKGNPFGGFESKPFQIGHRTVSVRTGFAFDAGKAKQQQTQVTDIKSDNEAYMAKLLRITWVLDDKLNTLDNLLFVPDQGDDCLAQLCSLYRATYDTVLSYYWNSARYLDFSSVNASGHYQSFSNKTYVNDGAKGDSAITLHELDWGAPSSRYHMPDDQRIYAWLVIRRDIIRTLLKDPSYGDDLPAPTDHDAIWNRWVLYGMELWYDIPKAGYKMVWDSAEARKNTVEKAYFSTTGSFNPGWFSFTGQADKLYDRKAELYELLYDLSDQLDRLSGKSDSAAQRLLPGAGYRRFSGLPPGGDSGGAHGYQYRYTPPARANRNRWPHMSLPPPDYGQYFGHHDRWYQTIPHYYLTRRSTAELAKLLTVPKITDFSGHYYSNDNTPNDWGRLDLTWQATHPVGIPDYSLYRIGVNTQGTSSTMGEYAYRSAGTKATFSYPFIQGWTAPEPGNPPGTWKVGLRVRGAGGYPAYRVAHVRAGYKTPPGGQGEENWTPYDTTLVSSDNTPPSTPGVSIPFILTNLTELGAYWSSYDLESGIQEYRYSITHSYRIRHGNIYGPWLVDTTRHWTSVGGQTSFNIRGLNLKQGNTYILHVQAVNGVGLRSEVADCEFLVDATPPTKPHIRALLAGCDQSGQEILFQWDYSNDPETGVVNYRFRFGSSPGADDIASDYADMNGQQFGTKLVKGLHGMKAGKAYYLTLTAMNQVGLESSDSTQVVPQFNDNTPPSPGSGASELPIIVPPNPLPVDVVLFRTNATDNESGIYKYQFRIVKKNPYGVQIDWTDMPEAARSAATLGLPANHSGHWFVVRAINGVGLETQSECPFTW